MTLFEKLIAYRRALYQYRAQRFKYQSRTICEPQPEDFNLSREEYPQAIEELRREVLGEKKLENPPQTGKAMP